MKRKEGKQECGLRRSLVWTWSMGRRGQVTAPLTNHRVVPPWRKEAGSSWHHICWFAGQPHMCVSCGGSLRICPSITRQDSSCESRAFSQRWSHSWTPLATQALMQLGRLRHLGGSAPPRRESGQGTTTLNTGPPRVLSLLQRLTSFPPPSAKAYPSRFNTQMTRGLWGGRTWEGWPSWPQHMAPPSTQLPQAWIPAF